MSIPYPPSVKTLDKFGVSVRGSKGQGPLLQPKLKYRYRVLFLGFGGQGNTAEPLSLNTNTCGLPTQSTSKVTIHSYNSQAHFAGKATWEDITLNVRDTIDNTVAKTIGAQLQYQNDHYNQTGRRAAQDYKFTMIIQFLDGNHDTANSAWTLEGAWLTNVQFGDLDYSAVGDTINIGMTISYDNAILESQEGINSIFGAVPADPLGNFIAT